ncbi:MAG: hypothetical protein OXF79_29300 [Chloroflexi bacterium]|nr:hypothetical protein [Chloroflexota bacterium]
MAMLPPHPTDEHLTRARTQRDAENAAKSHRGRGVTFGDVALLSGLGLAVVAVITLAVLVLI